MSQPTYKFIYFHASAFGLTPVMIVAKASYWDEAQTVGDWGAYISGVSFDTSAEQETAEQVARYGAKLPEQMAIALFGDPFKLPYRE